MAISDHDVIHAIMIVLRFHHWYVRFLAQPLVPNLISYSHGLWLTLADKIDLFFDRVESAHDAMSATNT